MKLSQKNVSPGRKSGFHSIDIFAFAEVIPTADPNVAFEGIDAAFLVGAFPRKDGMLRKDLLTKNMGIFQVQGKSLNKHAKKSVKVNQASQYDVIKSVYM